MNMNFIAFSSRAKLLDRPRLLLGHRVHVVLDKIHQADGLQNPPAAGEWLRTPACRSEGAEIDSRDGYARKSARRARSSAAMRRYGSEPSSAVRASRDSSALSIAWRAAAGYEARR